jgi:hypothetical protein
MIQICRNQVHTGTPHIFCLTTTSIPCVFVMVLAPESRSKSRLYSRTRYFTAFMLSTSAKVLQWYRYAGIKSTQAPHTYSVSQPLAYHVYLWRYWYPKAAQTHGYIAGLDISLLLFSQLPPKSFNDTDMPESSPHRNPTCILSHNH